ncbi:MAG: ABC transporter permease [Bacteroidaceae bacterium]|nr:ABC transporter permease [Bacteroidaceae bacterium]MBQ8711191.1 ABC transporter permease [Bacteroidaceae bacterium]
MSVSFYIAKRYLLSKKSHSAINLISGVSVCGVAIATAALVCILSVFNGFQDMVAGLFTAMDPELKVVPAVGKFMAADAKGLAALREDADVEVLTETLEDQALLMVNNRQVMATVKGVEDNFEELTGIDNILVGEGVFELHADVIDYGILGANLLMQLGLPADFDEAVQVYAPRKGERIDLNDPRESLNQEELYSPKVGFMVKQNKYDAQYVITNIAFARRLFERQGEVSAVEMKLRRGADVGRVKARMQQMLGADYVVKDRYEQQEDTFKIMQIEKLISYIFLTFILMIACFNIIGSLSMLIIDKKQDALTLRNLGANEGQIRSIFMFEGRMICLLGAVTGILVGLTLCWLQQEFGLIRFGSSEGSYIINAYPVSVRWMDLLLIFVTVIAVGFLSVWYPVRRLSRKMMTSNL